MIQSINWIFKKISGIEDQEDHESDDDEKRNRDGDYDSCDDTNDISERKNRKLTYAEVINNALFVKLELPRIVVIGNESSGKSSTLERICGREIFPRSEKMCTKQPIELKLRTDKNIPPEYTQFTLTFPGQSPVQMSNEKDVREKIEEHMQKLEPSSHPILIEIRSIDVPTLDLVDLPGLYTSKKTENDSGKEMIDQCVKNYIQSQDIGAVVLVLSARNPVIQDNAIRIIQEISEKGFPDIPKYCITAFTMCDRIVDRNWEGVGKLGPLHELLDKLFPDKDNPCNSICKAGSVALINRDSTNITKTISLSDQLRQEKSFFLTMFDQSNSNEMVQSVEVPKRSNKRQKRSVEKGGDVPLDRTFTDQGKERLGLCALIKKIETVFCRNLASTWTSNKIDELIVDTEKKKLKLLDLGTDPKDIMLSTFIDHSKNQLRHILDEPVLYEPIWHLVDEKNEPSFEPISQKEVDLALRNIELRDAYLRVFEGGEFLNRTKEILGNKIRSNFGRNDNLKFDRFVSHRESLIESLEDGITREQELFKSGVRTSISALFAAIRDKPLESSDIHRKIISHVVSEFSDHIILKVIGRSPNFLFANEVFSKLEAVPPENCADNRVALIKKLSDTIDDLREFQENHGIKNNRSADNLPLKMYCRKK